MQTLKITQWRAAAFISLFLLAAGSSTASSSNEQQHKLTATDESAIRAIIEAYRTAWLANDAKGVLNTFSDDAVLLPAHGAPAVVGIAAIEKYWFTPDGPPTTITELNITVDEASGNGILRTRAAWTALPGQLLRRAVRGATPIPEPTST